MCSFWVVSQIRTVPETSAKQVFSKERRCTMRHQTYLQKQCRNRWEHNGQQWFDESVQCTSLWAEDSKRSGKSRWWKIRQDAKNRYCDLCYDKQIHKRTYSQISNEHSATTCVHEVVSFRITTKQHTLTTLGGRGRTVDVLWKEGSENEINSNGRNKTYSKLQTCCFVRVQIHGLKKASSTVGNELCLWW